MSNIQSSFHVINLKLDIEKFEPSLVYCRVPTQCVYRSVHPQRLAAGRCAVQRIVMNIYAQAAGGAYRRHILD